MKTDKTKTDIKIRNGKTKPALSGVQNNETTNEKYEMRNTETNSVLSDAQNVGIQNSANTSGKANGNSEMRNSETNEISYEFSEILKRVEKPARYTGGEHNLPDMQKKAAVRFCMCFPETYEIGMSNAGLSLLYAVINARADFIAERCFAPWTDFAAEIRQRGVPLMSVETKKPLKDFDILGFSVQHELIYTNVLYMLDLAGIPFRAKDRDDSYPILIGGGPCCVNPMPYADFFDAVLVGEGENALVEFGELYKKYKGNKTEFLKAAQKIRGFFIPSLSDEKTVVRKAFVEDFDASIPPLKPLVPNIEIVHDRAVVELYRGCRSGCRFCQAAFFYRPIRERKKQTVKDIIFELIKNTGFDEITLASLSTSDYSCLRDLMNEIKPELAARHINLSLPSLRLDSFFAEYTDASRKSSLTFAPEAGTQRLRDVINKNISDENITQSITRAFNAGYRSVKLYFMIGLPTETETDILGIVEIVKKIRALYREICRNNSLNITVSTSVFIPKPLTPFQRERMISEEEAAAKQNLLKNTLNAMKGVRYHYHDASSSRLECAMARGGAELSKVIETAYRKGCFFDAWSEKFDQKKWDGAFKECGIGFGAYLDEIGEDKKLPWEFIDFSVRHDYLEYERKKAYTGKTTPGCFEECNHCGAECGF
ncbi:MAG: TIGR03960 family B12-binding radical SAM protein [Clostridiales bacterium]|jgi:radical SAM family uncharacterized protein|nr:TIGR03960 family B12-binding radical SAM protein [Clostridiales bacterium]